MQHEHHAMHPQPREKHLPISSEGDSGEHEVQRSHRHRDWPFLLPIGLLAAVELALLIAWLTPR